MSSGKDYVQNRPDKDHQGLRALFAKNPAAPLGWPPRNPSHPSNRGFIPFRMAATFSVFLGAIVALLAGLAIVFLAARSLADGGNVAEPRRT